MTRHAFIPRRYAGAVNGARAPLPPQGVGLATFREHPIRVDPRRLRASRGISAQDDSSRRSVLLLKSTHDSRAGRDRDMVVERWITAPHTSRAPAPVLRRSRYDS